MFEFTIRKNQTDSNEFNMFQFIHKIIAKCLVSKKHLRNMYWYKLYYGLACHEYSFNDKKFEYFFIK